MSDGGPHTDGDTSAAVLPDSGAPRDEVDSHAPELDLQRARDLAWRALNRRDRTVSEVRAMLADKQVAPAAIETVVAELSAAGYLDDARYAERFAEDRRRLDAWGRERIERRLGVLGVPREHIVAAISGQDREAELQTAVDLLRRRFSQPPADDRERSRALGLLVRRGYEAETAYEAIRRHAGEPNQ